MIKTVSTSITTKKNFTAWLCNGILIGFAIGLVKAGIEISSNHYLKYGMYKLALDIMRSCLNRWIFIFFILFLLGVVLRPLFRLAWKLINDNLVKIQVVDRNRFLGFFLSLFMAISFFFWGGYWIIMDQFPPTHHIRALLVSLYKFMGYFFKSHPVPQVFLIVILCCLIFLVFGWVISKIGLADLFLSIGKIVISGKIFILTVAILLVWGIVNANVGIIFGRGDLKHKNVIMISIDTLRADHMGCYGYFRNTTPYIDTLAQRGILFKNAFTPWPKTTPAVTSAFTGQYGHTHGIMRIAPFQHLKNGLLLLAEIMRNEGFYTQAIVSNVVIGKSSNINQGFDDFREVHSHAKNVNKEAFMAVEQLKEMRQNEKPFFLWVHYIDPHGPYKPPEYRNEFFKDRFYDSSEKVKIQVEPLKLVAIDEDQGAISPHERTRRGAINRASIGCTEPNVVEKETEELAYYVAMYDAEIRFVDHQIGILIDKLEAEGLLENSMLVLWSDHGESMGEHNYYFQHGRFPYNACLKIPLIIINPNYRPVEIESPVSLLDITPTILDFLSIDHPLDFEGVSLVPIIEGKEWKRIDLFAESGYAIDFQKILIRGDWKLIFIPDELDRSLLHGEMFELYNIAKDPAETNELSNSNKHVLNEMKKSLFVWTNSWTESFGNSDFKKVEYSKEGLKNLRSLGYLH